MQTKRWNREEVETLNNKHVHFSQEAILFLFFFLVMDLGRRNMKGTTLCCRSTKSGLKTTATKAA